MSVCLSACRSNYLFVCLSVCPSVRLFVCPSINLPVRLSVCVHLLAHLDIWLSNGLSVYLSGRLYVNVCLSVPVFLSLSLSVSVTVLYMFMESAGSEVEERQQDLEWRGHRGTSAGRGTAERGTAGWTI
jgi:hypothetical protein